MTIRSILSKWGNKMEDRILLKELADKAQPEFKDKIVLARVNGKLCELWKKVYPDSKIEYITTAQSDGLLTYKRSATLIMLKAIYDVYGHTDIERVKVEFSLSKGYYCTVKGYVSVNDEFICRVKARLREIVDGDMPIIKHTIPKDEAVRHFGNHGMYDKEKLFRYRKSSTVNVYRLDGFEDYYYGYMVPSSGYIQHYELFLYDKGFVIQFPTVENTKDIPEFAPQNKLFKVLDESTEWCRMLGVETVGDLNETIVSGNIKELILVQDALQEKKLADIAQRISDDPSKKFIPHKTLLFFDEITEFPEIATSLKFFHEDGRFDVICSGSMLGVNYKKIESNSVGYKKDNDMFSMDFEEFLWAKGYDDTTVEDMLLHMRELLPFNELEMQVYHSLFLDFCILGGMPAVEAEYIEKNTFEGSLDTQRQLIADYKEDIRKYAQGLDQARILNVFNRIAPQLARENKKFQISKVATGARFRDYRGCAEWLADAGMVNICFCLEFPELPLGGSYDPDVF